MAYLDFFFFAVWPYMAIILAISGSVYRYVNQRFSFTSQSSQFLGDSRLLFWGSVTWHYGIVLILGGHLIAFIFVQQWGELVAEPIRLYVLEVTGWVITLVLLLGLLLLIFRRLKNTRAFATTSIMDWVMLLVLLLQVFLGLWISFFFRWGALWYSNSVVPWLTSLVSLNPQIGYVASLPLFYGIPVIQLHFINAFLLVAIFPFTRLVHIFTVPLTYLWRPYQVVVWYRQSRNIKQKN